MSTVYLAGPITGCSYDECTNWRQETIKKLKEYNITGLSPMRQKDYLINEKIVADSYSDKVIKGITARDRWDATRCDVILVNLLGAKKVSIGTVMEIAWADSERIPIVLVMEKENIHHHSMILEVTGFWVETLDEGVQVVKNILFTGN